MTADSHMKNDTMLLTDGWSKRSVASNSAQKDSLKARCSSVAPRESMPAAINGVSGSTSVPKISKIEMPTEAFTAPLSTDAHTN